MSLIEQARALVTREFVEGIVPTTGLATAVDVDGAAVPAAESTLDGTDAERIRQEWDAQPHHP